jgi:hypothetical protein
MIEKALFEYALVARIAGTEPVRWQWKGPGQIAEGGLLGILNAAGKEGWEVVAAGDFGGSPTAEVLLKRALGG